MVRPVLRLTLSAAMICALTSLEGLASRSVAAAPAQSKKAATQIDLNTATEEQLQGLPGIGPAHAKKIIAGRPYKSVKELSKSGLPAATIEKIAPLVTVKPVTAIKKTSPKPVTARRTPYEEETKEIDLNAATEEQLQGLPGIGPANAKKIIAGRPYKSVKDLSKSGLPAATIEKIAPMVTVKADKPAASARTTEPAVEQAAPKKGMVWVNTDSNIYHKEGSPWYGKTKQGKWMTEADAIKEGNRAAKE